MKTHKVSIEVAGRTLSFETGKLAQQAHGAVVARYGDSVVLAAVVMGQEDLKKDYFPLSVEYQERLYANGRIKGSRWIKRERGTDAETLSARLIDRSIRPLFPSSFRNEVQVIVTVLAADVSNDVDVLGINAVSAALAISQIPWNGPVAAVRMGLIDNRIVINDQNGNRKGVDMDMVVTSTEDLIPMIEAGANQVPESTMFEAMKVAVDENKKIVTLLKNFAKEVGKEKLPVVTRKFDPQVLATVQKQAKPLLEEYIKTASSKEGGDMSALMAKAGQGLEDKQKSEVPGIIEDMMHDMVREQILKTKIRPDGRKLEDIRDLTIEVDLLPRVHGSAMFQRGQTQALTVTTLGAPSLAQTLESVEGEEQKRYMHHYNFPPYSTGETKRVGAPSRREIGHGALAERALEPVIPSEQEFPYAIRVVSEIMGSNGSSSMASTCGSTLSLMAAGVPIKAPVAGISTGLVTGKGYPKDKSDFVLLTDIVGMEDHYGDMDFKIAGTDTGVTAIQLDVKVEGLTLEICEQTFARAKTARTKIMQAMLEVIPASRKGISQYAPKISTVQIPVEKIGELIGPGGKNIKKLMADYEVQIDVDDLGSVFVTGLDELKTNKVLEYLKNMGREIKVGEVFEGTVANLAPFGAFVNILPGKDGLVHVSRMSMEYVNDPGTLVTVGQTLKVWVTEVTPEGKVGLSMLFDEAGNPVEKVVEGGNDRPRGPRPMGGNRGGFDRDRRGGGGSSHFNGPRRRF